MDILSNDNNPNTLKLIIAAEIGNKSIEIDFESGLKKTESSRFPVLKIKALNLDIFSISAAVQFLAPVSEEAEIVSQKWLEWESTRLQPAIVAYGGTGKLVNSQKSKIANFLKELNDALKNKQYLIEDNSVTVVDTSIWATLWSTILPTEIGESIAKEYPEIDRWAKSIEKLPIIEKSIQKIKLERGIKAIMSIYESSWFPQLTCNSRAIAVSKESSDLKLAKEKEPDEVTNDELNFVKSNWSSITYPSVQASAYPVLPKQGEKNILITSALPYVNNVPHLGNIIGCVLSADIFARYCRQRNYNTLYVCGTDEYGTATEAKALEENSSPQKICDKYFDLHNDVYRWFGIGFDYFGRTTTPEQTEIVQKMFLRVKEKNFIISNSVDQLLCQTCDRFLADRFVEGTCPGCKYEDARGDQCDGCGHLVNATELINPRCKTCNTKPIIKPSMQFFLDLPNLQERLRTWAGKVESGWSPAAKAVSRPWLRDPLKPRCITRDLKWGIPVPLEKYKDKVFYVWFDAPVGYISITKKYTNEYERWWKPKDCDVDLYQFMAKDNVPFHAIMFPACLLAADQGHVLVKHIMATEYLNYEDTKFSKSRGIGVFGSDAQETGIPADVYRFYLAYIRPENQDSNFNWADLASKNNNELLNNLGNFVNRALMFAEKNFDKKIPEMFLTADDYNVLALVQRELNGYISALEQCKLKDGVKHVLAISKHGNQYMQFQQPWVKVKGGDEDRKRAGTIIGLSCNIAGLLSALLAPFMPNTARELRGQLGLPQDNCGFIPEVVSLQLKSGHLIGKPSPLFSKIEDQQVSALRNKYAGRQGSTPPREELNAKDLEAAIAKQGQLVRDLKAKSDKSIWQPQVDILKDLKNKLSKLTLPSPKEELTAEQLDAAIAKQGQLVRDLKAKGDKSIWEPQVKILKDLKSKLTKVKSGKSS